MKLNIGCADQKRNDWINLDKDAQWSPDVCRDLARGLPFSDRTVTEVYAKNVLEHLNPDDLIFTLQELQRVTVTKAKVEIIVPLGIVPDLSHQSFFHEYSFENMLQQGYRYGLQKLHVLEKGLKKYEKPFDYTELRIVLERE